METLIEIPATDSPEAHSASGEYGFIKVRPNTQKWLNHRTKGLGASESAIIWSLNKYVNVPQWISDKINRTSSFEGNFKTDYGHHCENTVLDWANQRLPGMTNPKGIYTYDGVIMATPDRVIHQSDSKEIITVDAKNCGAGAYFGFKKDQKLPIYYWAQAQQQMLAANAVSGFIVVNYANETFCYYKIDRSDVFLDAHIPHAKSVMGKIIYGRAFKSESRNVELVIINEIHRARTQYEEVILSEYEKTHYPWHIDT